MTTYERNITYSAEQQEAFSQLVNDRLRALGWSRAAAAEKAGIPVDKVQALARTVPPGMSFGYFVKACLALDIDLYSVAELLGLDTEVKELMHDQEHYPNARRGFSQEGVDPLDALVNTLPGDRREKARGLIEMIIRNV